MPGVGVAPGLKGFRRFAGSGMPGVGVAPFGTLFAFFGSGIPGVEFADGSIGFVERPSGRLFGSTFTLPAPAGSTFAFVLEFDVVLAQAEIKIAKDKAKRPIKTFDINFKNLFKFKMAVPV